VDGNVRQLAQSRHEAVASIVDGALKAQPSLNVVDVTAALLKQFATHDCAGVAGIGDLTRKAMEGERAPSKVDLEVSRESIPIVIIDAPFPEAAMGGDAYDAIDATQCLPDFDRLPAEFGKKHSVIRTGDKTVVMNAAHYADLLQARDIAIKARQDSEIYQQAAAAAVQSLSDIETILGNDPASIGSLTIYRWQDGTFSVSAGGESRTDSVVRLALKSMAEVAVEMRSRVESEAKVTDETTYQSGVEEVSFRVEPASCDEKCQTEPVDSAGQTGATQDTKEPTSEQF
jgi:hypothetical protein